MDIKSFRWIVGGIVEIYAEDFFGEYFGANWLAGEINDRNIEGFGNTNVFPEVFDVVPLKKRVFVSEIKGVVVQKIKNKVFLEARAIKLGAAGKSVIVEVFFDRKL